MRKILFSIFLILFFFSTLCSRNSFAQDFMQIGLPEGTKARLGKGSVIGDIVYLSDGMRLAVPSRIGVWIYDVQTGEALDLIRVPIDGYSIQISFSRDGQTLATANGKYDFTTDFTIPDTNTIWTLRLWDVRTGELRHTLTEESPDTPRILLFSPDGQTFATTSIKSANVVRDGLTYAGSIYALRLWDVRTGALRHTLMEGENAYVEAMSFSSDGRTLITTHGARLHLWNVHTGKLLAFKDGDPVRAIRSLSPNGQIGVEFSWVDPTIHLWDLSGLWDGPETRPIYDSALIGHTEGIADISLSSDGQILASNSRDGTIRLWNTRTDERLRTPTGYNTWPGRISLSPDGRSLAHSSRSRDSRTISLWDARTGEHLHTLRHLHTLTGHTSWKEPIFSPDGQTLVAHDGNQIALWDVHTGERRRTLTDTFFNVSLSPDGQTLAATVRESTTGHGNTYTQTYAVRLWDVRTGKHLPTLTKRTTNSIPLISFSPDGQILAVFYWDGTTHLWDVRARKSLRSFTGYSASFNHSIRFSPDGQALAIRDRDGKKIHLSDVRTGKRLRTLTGHTGGVLSVVYSPNGDTIASSSWDGTIRLWDARTGKHFRTLKQYANELLFSPDGQTLLTQVHSTNVNLWNIGRGYSTNVDLWNVRTGTHLHTFMVKQGRILLFSPDGQTLAIGRAGGKIELWNISTGANLHTLTGYGNDVHSGSFSPDGQTLATNDEGTVLLWDLSSLLPQEPVVQVEASQRPPMYWVDTQAGTLHRLIDDTVENLLPSTQKATHLAVDTAKGKLYWTEKTGKTRGKIRSADLNGLNEQLVKKLTSVPLDLALDAVGGQLYLTNSRGRIQRLNVDGSGFHPNLIPSLEAPEHLALDLERGKIYWTEKADARTGNVRRANLDGTNVELVKKLRVMPVGIALDSGNRKIYLATAAGKIQRLNLNGSGYQRNFIRGLDSLGEIAVDVTGSKLYWTEKDSLRRANLNGDNIQDVVTRLGAPADLALGIAQVQDAIAAAPILTGMPDQTLLLANYPNPFNPETWIPYHLAEPGDVSLAIYAVDGRLVRRLALGHQLAGIYASQSRAAYWNGRNAVGEPVASGVYFYTLTAGNFTATRKMLIRK